LPAKSKAQQRYMGMVHGVQKGTVEPGDVSPEVRKTAKTMKKKDAKDFATTKHKGLPMKVKKEITEGQFPKFSELKVKDRITYHGKTQYMITKVTPKEIHIGMIDKGSNPVAGMFAKNAIITKSNYESQAKMKFIKDVIQEHSIKEDKRSNKMSKKRLVEHFYSTDEIKAVHEGIFEDEKPKLTPEIKEKAIAAIKEYAKFGKMIYREGNLREVAKTLSEIADFAGHYTVEEAGDWFDAVTVKRNMGDLKKLSLEFAKVSGEVQGHQDRMSALYEDMGGILNRYFDIQELVDEQPPATRDMDSTMKVGDRAVVNTNVVRKDDPTPSHVRRVNQEIVRGRGTVKIHEFVDEYVVVSGGDIGLFEVKIPLSSLSKVVPGQRIGEAAKYKKATMEKYVKKDKFLGAQYKTGTDLEKLFNTYVLGDSAQEKLYNKVK